MSKAIITRIPNMVYSSWLSDGKFAGEREAKMTTLNQTGDSAVLAFQLKFPSSNSSLGKIFRLTKEEADKFIAGGEIRHGNESVRKTQF